MFFTCKRTRNHSKEREIALYNAPDSFYEQYSWSTSENGDKSRWSRKIILTIQQSEIAFPSSSVRIIASAGAGPCVIFAVRDREHCNGFFAHVFTSSEIAPSTFGGDWLLHQLDSFYQGGTLDVYIIGGYNCLSDCMLANLDAHVDCIDKKYRLGTVYKQVKENWASSVVLDFDTGDIYQYEPQRHKYNRRSFHDLQALITTFSHFFCPCATRLIEYPPNSVLKENNTLPKNR